MPDPSRSSLSAQRFNLLRYFTGASLAVILIISVATGSAAAWLVREAFLDMERDESDNLAENLVTLFREAGFSADRWAASDAPEGLRARVAGEMENFDITEFTLYALDGRQVEEFSLRGQGARDLWPEGFDSARRGAVALRWESAMWWPLAVLGGGPGGVESFTPVREAGSVVAVARVRRDRAPLLAQAQEVLPRLVLLAGAAALVVFSSLWVLVRHADRIMGRQRRALESAGREVESRNRLLEDLTRRKDDFYTMCSHDLKSPLLSVHAGCRLLLSDASAPPSAPQRDVLEDNLRSAQTMLDLVNNLLDFARIEGGVEKLSAEDLDLSAVVTGVVAAHRLQAAGRGVRLELGLPDGEVRVVGDRMKLQRVIGNLLSNAIKHAARGSVAVTVERAAPAARIAVIDQGPGIPAEEIPTLFERFTTGAGRKGGPAEGTGLGLAIVKHFVQLHGGKVSVASEAGKGASFIVTLPLAPAERREVAESALVHGSSIV